MLLFNGNLHLFLKAMHTMMHHESPVTSGTPVRKGDDPIAIDLIERYRKVL